MIPRGHLKSTIVTFAHTIQWIINYPDIRILLSTHTDGAAKQFMNELRKHFTHGEGFRWLFPEHVPHGKGVREFGNQEHFDTMARRVWRKEHTVQFVTVGSSIASVHFEVTKHDDIVDKENVRTPEQCEVVRAHLGMCGPLVETHAHPKRGEMSGWVDLTGTFYDFSDVNYSIYEAELPKLDEMEWERLQKVSGTIREEREKELMAKGRVIAPRIWALNVQSAAPNWPDPPYLWPERCGFRKLKEIETDPAEGPSVLASQYLMNPTPKGSGLVEDESQIIWTPRRVLNELYARMTLEVTMDLAGMDDHARNKSENDFSVLNLHGIGTDGHIYIYELQHGRPTPHEVIEQMFDLMKRHPRIRAFKVPKDHFARVLLPFLKAEEIKRGVFLPIMEMPIDNRQSKKQKIKGLQPWFQRGMIHWADDLPCAQWIRWEVLKFPKFAHDDILDTTYDAMAGFDGEINADILPTERPTPTPRSKTVEIPGPDGTRALVQVETPSCQVTHEFLFGEVRDDVSCTGWD